MILRPQLRLCLLAVISPLLLLPFVCGQRPPVQVSGMLVRIDQRTWHATAAPGESHVAFQFPLGPVVLLDESASGRYVLPSDAGTTVLRGRGLGWVLPQSPTSKDPGWMIGAQDPAAAFAAHFSNSSKTVRVIVHGLNATLRAHEARPHADVQGGEFRLDFPGSDAASDTLAGFYWGTMVPCVVERTRARDYPRSDGFVISTLADKYVGTYPDVDHEFQIKGRVAVGSRVDVDIVRRMMELQLRLMRDDPCLLMRIPCALQPSGAIEYHVRRNSLDRSANANMFLVTGNVELMESVWLYVARTKDSRWLAANMDDIESAASQVELLVDPLGRLWGDVYYEDQVIKDGRETLAQALAARAFDLLGQLQDLVGRRDKAAHSRKMGKKLAACTVRPLPVGYWDPRHGRFVDWVDRSGSVHDHAHLLANILPVMLGFSDANQSRSVLDLVGREQAEFQRFPSFLAARIGDYSDSEIGDGGPYDLCAAARYWAWDAAFWSWRHKGAVLKDQIAAVAAMAAADDYVMGERYDMNHVYYGDDPRPWHGAAHYYEYPCVFAWVLLTQYLGLRPSLVADLDLAPRLVDAAAVRLDQAAYRLQYDFRPEEETFTLVNRASVTRTFTLDLAALFPAARCFARRDGETGVQMGLYEGGSLLELLAGRSLVLSPSTSCVGNEV